MRSTFALAAFALAACSASDEATDVQSAAETATKAQEATESFPSAGEYEPSPAQLAADQSFSSILIETPLVDVQDQLQELRENGCERYRECDWQDRNKVRYYFWGGPGELRLVAKHVDAQDFVGRSIPALGIGTARTREDVLDRVHAFIPGSQWRCEAHLGTCFEATGKLKPGWVRLSWNDDDTLASVELHGYHFT
ncbi:hypothetical protein [Alteraurantiacibacter aquimixticola]|uniref:Lipoprotein n=1 Tax=Alteraurantiacibacter aquimixticola TaxID=2489173 RepID=A0A4T3EZU3_9SPHN|nr:hypothetical protein [Alteraurantiacibacter aquimixticola]TIX50302.1 hypothetical protein E5222_08435 [Alteraurantiacibacter aquimixticola]